MVNELDSSQLADLVRVANRPALVLFYGNWCVDCVRFKPTWQSWTLDKETGVYALEIARGAREWDEWRIDEIPTVAAFAKGAERGRAHGTISADDLDRLWQLVEA